MSWTNRVKEYAFQYLLKWASRRRAIRSVLGEFRFQRRRRQWGKAPPDSLRVGLVQLQLEPVSSVAAYVRAVAAPLAELVAQDVDLVVYPEDAASQLLGLLPGLEDLGAAESVDQLLADVAGPDVSVADIFRFLGPITRRIYRETFSSLARLTGTWIVAGSAILPDGDRVFNVAHVFDASGRLAGSQKKLHLLELERQWGLAAGADLTLMKTPFGRLAVPICMDAMYFEPFRIMQARGVEVAALPAANPEPYNVWRVLRGPWARAQDCHLFVLHACMVGRFAGLELTGRSAVYAPVEVTPDGTGVVAQLPDADAPGVLVADLDLGALRRCRADMSRSLNPQLLVRYLPDLYRHPAP